MGSPLNLKSQSYIDWVRRQPCFVCGIEGGDAHHAIDIGLGGVMGGKAPDFVAVPLCRVHHDEVHRDADMHDQRDMVIRTLLKCFYEGVIGIRDE